LDNIKVKFEENMFPYRYREKLKEFKNFCLKSAINKFRLIADFQRPKIIKQLIRVVLCHNFFKNDFTSSIHTGSQKIINKNP